MGTLHLNAVISGLLLGAWPLFMNRSGLEPFISAVMFSSISLAVLLPAAFVSNSGALMEGRWVFSIFCLFLVYVTTISLAVVDSELTRDVAWRYVVAAGLCGAVGLLFLTDILSKTRAETVSPFFVLMLVFQMLVPAIYHAVLNGISIPKLAGFAAAALAAILLA